MTDETTAEMPVDAPLPEEQAPEPQPEVQAVEADDPSTQEDKPKGGFQRRIKELADERNHWRDMALRAQAPPPPEPPKVEEPTKLPTLEEYGYDEAKYQAALIQHATQLARYEVRKELDADRQKTAEQTRLGTFAERQQAFSKSVPDFEELVLKDPTLPITGSMRDVIIDSPSGPEIAYYLATNREQAEQIARLPPHLAALEMGRIEGRLQAIKEVKAKAPVVTKAPPPPPTIDAVEPEVNKDPDSMSMDEWKKWREKQIRRKK